MADRDSALALAPGSAADFVVRFAPASQRELLGAALLLDQQLAASVARCTDPGATRLKLDWWRQELTRGDASPHPLVRRLAPLAAAPEGLTAMQSLLDAAEGDVLRRRPENTAAFLEDCTRAGALARLLVMAGDNAAGAHAEADTLGRYARAVERIQTLGRRLRVDHNPLPRHEIPEGNIADWPCDVLADYCEQLLAPLHLAAEPLLRDRGRALAPARRWAAQARAVHRLLAREGYAVRGQYLDITPFARLWAAWRVR